MRPSELRGYPAPSRRALLGLAMAAPLLTAQMSPSDRTVALCEAWLAQDAEIGRLQGRWSEHETWLVRHHAWFRLSEAERRALPAAKPLRDIDARLDVLSDRRDELLGALPSLAAATPKALAAKLAVAARLVRPEDQPEAHRLIAAALRDLASFRSLPSRLA